MDYPVIQKLWDEFRIAKCFPNMTDLVINNCTERIVKGEYLPESIIEAGYRAPLPGSIYYVEQVVPPPWFVDDLQEEKVIVDIPTTPEEIKAARKAAKSKAQQKCRRKHQRSKALSY
jgi:hypothetical protein